MYDGHAYSFQDIFEMIDKKTTHQKNLECLAKEIYKFLDGLSSPVMINIFELRGNTYNHINFQSLYLYKKLRFGTETFTYRGLQIYNLISDNIQNGSSLENFKREIKKWKDEKCPCRISKIYLQDAGDLEPHKSWQFLLIHSSFKETFSEPNRVSEMEIFMTLTIFCKKFHFWYSRGFCIQLSEFL